MSPSSTPGHRCSLVGKGPAYDVLKVVGGAYSFLTAGRAAGETER